MYDPLDPTPNLPGCPSCRETSNVTIPLTSTAAVASPPRWPAVDLCPSSCGCYCHAGAASRGD